MSNKVLVIIILVVLLGGTLFAAFRIKGDNKDKIEGNNVVTLQSIIDNGAVTLTLSPKGYSDGSFYVDISLNTHSVELSQFNLKEILSLEYNGQSLKPISTPELNGHHSSGNLIFKVDKKPVNYKFKVEGFKILA